MIIYITTVILIMNVYNYNNNNSVTILCQINQPNRGVWGGGGGGGVAGGETGRVSEACFHGESCNVFVSKWYVGVQGVWVFNLKLSLSRLNL